MNIVSSLFQDLPLNNLFSIMKNRLRSKRKVKKSYNTQIIGPALEYQKRDSCAWH